MPGTSGHLGTGPAGRGSAFGAHLDARGWHPQLAASRHGCHGQAFCWIRHGDLVAADRLGRGFTRIRGIGVSTVPLPDRSDLSAVRGSRMDWPWPVGAVQCAHHLACHPTGSTLVQSSGRVVGWHGPGRCTTRCLLRPRLSSGGAAAALCSSSVGSPQHLGWNDGPRGHSR